MRNRRTTEEVIGDPYPLMYSKSCLHLVDALRSSFPSWDGMREFDWLYGWTRLGDYYADGYFSRDEMRELVHNRFGVRI